VDTPTFNAFMLNVIRAVPADGTERWFLMDNASFHALEDLVEKQMGEKHIGITHTAPSTCFLDPIEEFFSVVTSRFLNIYYQEVLKDGHLMLTREKVKQLIRQSFRECGPISLIGSFARPCLLLTPSRV
jgi:hypothetical protein